MKGFLSKSTILTLALMLMFGSVLPLSAQKVEASVNSPVYTQFENVVDFPTQVKALIHANPNDYISTEIDDFLDPQSGDLYVAFDVELVIEDYDVEDAWAILSELTNDSVWYEGNSTTTLIREGNGSKKIGRQWLQTSDFGGFPTEDIVTRVFADVEEYQVFYGTGTLTEYLALNTFRQEGDDVVFNYKAILHPNLPVPEEGLTAFLNQVPVAYIEGFLPYVGKTGTSYVNTIQFYTF